MVLLYYFRVITAWGFLPVVPVMIIAFSVYLVSHAFLSWRDGELSVKIPGWLLDPFFYLLFAVFVMSIDFWAWGKYMPQWVGFPMWLGYFIILSALQTFFMIKLLQRNRNKPVFNI
jgi:hypothetical protein